MGNDVVSPPSASPPRSPHRLRPKSPVKLTPLERKARDRQRLKDQAQRRAQAVQNREADALALLASQHKSSQWHDAERQEEELVLRRLERDLVDVQRCHPTASGYRFDAAQDARDVTKSTPVFQGYSPAPSPACQTSSVTLSKVPAAALRHPAFMSYCVAKQNDATAISPVFFFVRYHKIPLNEIEMDDEHVESDSDSDDEATQTQEQFLARQQLRDGPGAGRMATITKLAPDQQLQLQELLHNRFAANAGAKCSVCRGRSSPGCPGCFDFSPSAYHHVQSAKSTQRLKTPKTHAQEANDRQARYKGLRLKAMGFGRRTDEDRAEQEDAQDEEVGAIRPSSPSTELHEYYVNVLATIHDVRKHRTLRNNYVTLHIKTLPVGNLITLQVDVTATVAYVYELYRSRIESPNRPIHLLLPTTSGLFYLNERMETATDTRCGLVNGEFLVEDFHLYAPPLAKRPVLRETTTYSPEFLLISVAILSENTTPQLVANFIKQNFFLDEETSVNAGFHIEYAITRLPPGTMKTDTYQRRLVPHVRRLQEVARVTKQLEQLELEREREQLLWLAYQERKQARLEHQQRQRRLGQGDGHVTRKVLRAIAYLEMILEATSNPSRPRVWEDRLEKLWRCAQFFEEWKLCKHGRLVDAENTAATRALIQRHSDATIAAFDAMLQRSTGAGPLAYPIQCVNSTLVVRIGTRLGCRATDNYEYGLVLDLSQHFEPTSPMIVPAERQRMKTRGFTKKQLFAMNEDDVERQALASSWRCSDYEWKLRASTTPTLLCTGSDLGRPPFLHFPWHTMVLAYQQVVQSLAFQLAQLDAFNALARSLQSEDTQLSKAQITQWHHDVEHFEIDLNALGERSPLVLHSMLLRATQQTLAKKGLALLKQRLRQRRQKLRDREAELERLRLLQEEHAKPKLSTVERLKQHFLQDKAPKLHALLEPTPVERLRLKAEQLLGVVTTKAATAAAAAKKEYDVRAL